MRTLARDGAARSRSGWTCGIGAVRSAARQQVERLEGRVLLAAFPVGPEFRVNSYTAGNQTFSFFSRAVASDSGGDFVVAWVSDSQDGSDAGIYAQRFNPAGVAQGSEFRVNTYTTNRQISSSVGMDAVGDFVVTWASFEQDGSSYGVYAQRYNAAGVPQGGEFQVNTYTTGYQAQPSVAVDTDGDFVIVWQSDATDGSRDVIARRYNSSGVAQSGEFRVNTYTTNNQLLPSIAADPAGNFVITWASRDQDGSNFGIYAQRYNSAGAKQGGEFRVNTYTTGFQHQPSIALDGNGNFVITWTSTDQDGSSNGVYAQRYSAAGAAQGGEFLVNSYTTNSQFSSAVASGAAGNFVITFDGQGVSGNAPYARLFDASGAAQGGEFRVNTTANAQSFAPVAMDAAGDFVVGWNTDGQDGSQGGIYAQRYQTVTSGLASAGDRVWNDLNGNGIQDGGEPGLAGVGVELHGAGGSPAGSAITDNAGSYSFPVLPGQGWYLRFSTPDGYIPTRDNQGGNDALDSDADRVTGQSPTFSIAGAGGVNNSIDAGYLLPASVSGIVFNDRNGNGTRQNGEELMPGFEVFADYDGDAAHDSDEPSCISSASGSYTVGSLPPGATLLAIVDQDLWTEPAAMNVAVPASLAVNGVNLAVRTNASDSSIAAAGAEFHVNTYIIAAQENKSVAMDGSGNFVVSWDSDGQDGSGYGVYAQRYNAAGAPQGAEFLVNTYTTGHQLYPSVAADAAGDFVIAWTSANQDAGSDGVYAQRYNAAGVAQGSELRVNTYTTGGQGGAAVSIDAAGNFVIAWSGEGQGDSDGIYAQRYNGSGVQQGGEFRVNTYTTNPQYDAQVALDADGDFVIAWNSNTQEDSYSSGIYAQRYNAAGVAQGTEFHVNTYAGHNQEQPAAAMNAAGNFVIAWHSDAQDSGTVGVYAQRYNAAGVPQGGEFRVNSYTTDDQASPSVGIDALGNFIIAWDSGNQDGFSFGIYGQRYNAAGVPQGAEFRVNSFTVNAQTFPAVAVNPQGDSVIAWQSSYQDASSWGVYAQRYAVVVAPVVTASQFVWNNAPQRIQISFDQDVSASLSSSDLVLQNLTTSTTVPSSSIFVSWNAATKIATFSFNPTLADGNYRATLLAAGVSNAQGVPMNLDHVLSFFFLNGDANHDRIVDVSDLGILATNWQATAATFSQADFNYDGHIDVGDLGILATNWQKSLPAAAPPQTAMIGPISAPRPARALRRTLDDVFYRGE